jgi:hypothetical protein
MIRPGSREYKGREVPINAEIKIDADGREYYQTGLKQMFVPPLRYLTTMKNISEDELNLMSTKEWLKVEWFEIRKYIDTSEILTIKLEIAERYGNNR